MSLRWRIGGEILCAAKTEAEPDDTYIDDRLHYELAVVMGVVVPDPDENVTGRWTWRETRGQQVPTLDEQYGPVRDTPVPRCA